MSRPSSGSWTCAEGVEDGAFGEGGMRLWDLVDGSRFRISTATASISAS